MYYGISPDTRISIILDLIKVIGLGRGILHGGLQMTHVLAYEKHIWRIYNNVLPIEIPMFYDINANPRPEKKNADDADPGADIDDDEDNKNSQDTTVVLSKSKSKSKEHKSNNPGSNKQQKEAIQRAKDELQQAEDALNANGDSDAEGAYYEAAEKLQVLRQAAKSSLPSEGSKASSNGSGQNMIL
jgi:hypothetical protein